MALIINAMYTSPSDLTTGTLFVYSCLPLKGAMQSLSSPVHGMSSDPC